MGRYGADLTFLRPFFTFRAEQPGTKPGGAEWASILQREGEINQQGQHYKTLAMLDETRAALREFYGQCNGMLSSLLGDKRWVGWGLCGLFYGCSYMLHLSGR